MLQITKNDICYNSNQNISKHDVDIFKHYIYIQGELRFLVDNKTFFVFSFSINMYEILDFLKTI